jgi:hypothetical protein
MKTIQVPEGSLDVTCFAHGDSKDIMMHFSFRDFLFNRVKYNGSYQVSKMDERLTYDGYFSRSDSWSKEPTCEQKNRLRRYLKEKSKEIFADEQFVNSEVNQHLEETIKQSKRFITAERKKSHQLIKEYIEQIRQCQERQKDFPV